MIDLLPYSKQFDELFPKYTDQRYVEIKELVDSYVDVIAADLDSDEFRTGIKLISPFIALRNYKTQIPFPLDLKNVIANIIALRSLKISEETKFSPNASEIFWKLLEFKGLGFPIVTTIFHFCHPDKYPIIDRYIRKACSLIKVDDLVGEFKGVAAPTFPQSLYSKGSSVNKYIGYISFLNRVLELQLTQYGHKMEYRTLDKALMVLGSEKLERVNANN
jgi:hypothetical protein